MKIPENGFKGGGGGTPSRPPPHRPLPGLCYSGPLCRARSMAFTDLKLLCGGLQGRARVGVYNAAVTERERERERGPQTC